MSFQTASTSRLRQSGALLVETLIAAGLSSLVMAGLVVGSILLQRQFAAATRFADAQSDQLRTVDFIEMDLRRATAVTTASGSTPLTLTLPNYYQVSGGKKVPRDPAKSGAKVVYGTGSVTVTYSLFGTRLVRNEGGVATTIATNVKTFPTPVRSGDEVAISLTFDGKLTRTGTAKDITFTSNTQLRNFN